jgi:uncharacterized damage-inducible protein DinB
MNHIEELIRFFGINHRVIKEQLDGLTHEDSLGQPPYFGNCLNWVVGHIVASRSGILSLLGEAPIWTDDEQAPYRRGSDPITGPDDPHLPLEQIIAALDVSQEALVAALNRVTPEKLAEEIPDRNSTVGKRVSFLAWHDSYHTGQTEQLRQLTGVNDQIIA